MHLPAKLVGIQQNRLIRIRQFTSFCACRDLCLHPARGACHQKRHGLRQKLDIHQAARAEFRIPSAGLRFGLGQARAHLCDIAAHGFALTFDGNDMAAERLDRIRQLRRARQNPRAGQRQMLPCPSLTHLIRGEAFQRGRHRPLAPRRPQPDINLVKPALRSLRRKRCDKGLRQPRVIGPRRKRPRAGRALDPRRVIDHDHIQIRPRIQPPRPQTAHAQTNRPPPRSWPVTGGKIRQNHRPQRADHRLGKIGVLPARLKAINQPAQMMHADAEMPFLCPAPCGIQLAFVIGSLGQLVRKIGAQCGFVGPS